MKFRNHSARRVVEIRIPGDRVLDKRDFAGCVALLLKPGNSPAVGLHHGDDIIQPIPVAVVHAHLRATWAGACCSDAERLRMIDPRLLLTTGGRLLEPSVALHHIHASVAINIADTEAVIAAAAPRTGSRNLVND